MSWQKCISFSKCSDLETEKVTDFKLCHQRDKSLSEFCFQFEFFFNFDFQMHTTHLKSFVFEILFIGDYSSTFYLFDGIV